MLSFLKKFFSSFVAVFAELFGRKKTEPTVSPELTPVVVPTQPVVLPEPQPEPVAPRTKWTAPIHFSKFVVTQPYLNYDPETYTKTGHHPGTDYGTQGEDMIPLYFCADGEVIEEGFNQYFGNYFFYYVPEVNCTFVYFHLRDRAPSKGSYRAGAVAGITGQTGLSHGIHLHIECMRGKQFSEDRRALYTSAQALEAATLDPDAFIRARLA